VSTYYSRTGQQITSDEWAALFGQKEYQQLASTHVGVSGSQPLVSTIWLGIDHNWGGGEPLIFETMVFGGSLDQECERYTSEAEAIAGHEAMCRRVQAS
jgi:hypothetical protein